MPVRVYQRGGRWWFDLRIGKERVRRPGGRTKQEAQAAGAQFLYGGAQPTAPGTVGAILDAWLIHKRAQQAKARTIRTIENSAARIRHYFGQKPLPEIDGAALDGFKSWRQAGNSTQRRAKHVGPHAVNGDLAVLRAAWNHAHREGMAPKPPAFKLLHEPQPNPKPVTREQFAMLMLQAEGPMRCVIALAGVLGLRNCEIRRLHWSHVNLTEQLLTVDMAHSKNHAERVLRLPDTIADLLREHRATSTGHAHVFTDTRGKPFSDYTLAKAARRVWERADLLDERPGTKVLHDLRATAASFAHASGANLFDLQAVMGWKSREVAERYIKAFDDRKSKIVDAVADALL